MLASNMMRMTLLFLVSLSLTGCPDFQVGDGGFIANTSPFPSNVIEDVVGQKYFVANEVSINNSGIPPKALFA